MGGNDFDIVKADPSVTGSDEKIITVSINNRNITVGTKIV